MIDSGKNLPGIEEALADKAALLRLMFAWADQGWIRELDVALAHRLATLAADAEPAGLLAAMLVSHQAGQGHLLLDLTQARSQPRELITATPRQGQYDRELPLAPDELMSRMGDDWGEHLRGWSAVGSGAGNQPLVLEGDHLYLRRYWRFEAQVAGGVQGRLVAGETPEPGALRSVLDRLFPPGDPRAYPARWQKLACALGARSRFAVITGGPGTGKTTTVIRLLALLQVLAMQSGGEPLRVRLAAPTGKAAARLNESISGQIGSLSELDLPQAERVRAAIHSEVTTLHRLLGARPDTRHFRHHRFHPLPLDVLVVDEASMVDIEMMALLLEALPEHARLVLLGDKDQLASVEAGAVLGSLCARAEAAHYHPALADWLEAATGYAIEQPLQDRAGRPLDQAVAMLRESFRFDATSGIGELARSVNAGDSRRARALLADVGFDDLEVVGLPVGDWRPLTALAVEGGAGAALRGYRHYLETIGDGPVARPGLGDPRSDWDAWALEILRAHGQFQVLTPLRQGDYGVETLNQQIEQALARAGLIREGVGHEGVLPSVSPETPLSQGLPDPRHGASDPRWYEGRPVLVTGNDYGLRLMNGDIGIALRVPLEFGKPERGTILRVAFPAGDGQDGIRWVLPSRLQQVETVYAMTVHKSQGSEFRHTALVMPDAVSPVLTRELVYTAVTRAREHFTLLAASAEVFSQAVERRVARQSQLFR